MTLSDVLGLLNLFGIVIGFGAAAYKLGRWNQSIEAKLAEHEERLNTHGVRLNKHRVWIAALMPTRPAGGVTE